METDVEKTADNDIKGEASDHVKRPGWRSLFNFTTRFHIFPLSVALVFSVASGVIIPALSIILGKMFDIFTKYGANELNGSELVRKVSIYGLVLVGLGSASGVLNAGYFMAWLAFGELQARNVRDRLFDAMLEKDMEWYDMRNAGIDTLISRLQAHVRELQIATSQPFGFAIQYTVTTFAALGVAFYTAWNLTLVTMAAVPLAAVILAWISARMQPSIDAQADELTQASKLANSAISAIDTVKYFNGQDFEVWQYANSIKRAAGFYLHQAQANAMQIGFVRFVTLGMFVQGFWYGTYLVTAGKKEPGQVLTAFWACLMATQAIEQILPQMIVLEKGRAAGATLKSVLSQMRRGCKTMKIAGCLTPSYCDADIEVRNVSFTYPSRPEQPALKNANFFFPAGETTFVVGRSGSGKSTLGNLLMHFYNPDSGELLIDGNPIQTLDINWLRNNVTLVQQQSVLFNEKIFTNIAFGRKDHTKVTKQEVKHSIETALLQQTISDLPNGLDTAVGINGSAMSGGQKQRVAIARARLRDTPILILDEATSALDHISKTHILERIQEWRRGKTTIIITHDMSQISEDEYVYVLDKGVIVQEGYQRALKQAETGPFELSLQPRITFPPTIGHRQRRKPSNMSSEESASLPSTVASEDPLGFKPVPSVFGSPGEGISNKGASPALISPLSPVAHPPNRLSIARSSFAPRRNISEAIDLLGDVTTPMLSPTREVGGKPQDAPNRSYDTENTISSSSHSFRRVLQAAITLPSKVRASMSSHQAQEPKRIKTEKPHGVAPIRKILKTVWPTLPWGKRVILVCGFFCAALHAGATPAFSYVFSKLLASFFIVKEHRSNMALKWSLSILGVAGLDAASSFAMHYLLENCGQAWVDALRIQALKRILDQPRAWFDRDKNNLTRLIECLDRNAEEMRNLVGRFAGFVFVAVTMMSLAITWSLVLCWKLTLVGLASAPFLYAVTRAFEAISGKWESKSNDAGEVASSIFTETFTNIRVVRALTLEGYFHKKYSKATYRALVIGLKRSAFSGSFYGLSDSGIIFATALIFYYGAILASSGHYSIQNIFTVFTMLLFSIANANAIIAFIPQMNSSRDMATRLLRLANLPYKKSHEHTGHHRLPALGPITFSSVSFTYPSRPSAQILSSLNLTLSPHKTTALVGASGSGKSTIASLLLGLYPPTEGTLAINTYPISALYIPSLRAFIAIVPQSPTIFPTTVASNITYGLPESSPLLSPANVRAAATAVGIHGFIVSLPRGYDTLIGAGGTGLSGGQAQRVAIARAVVRRPAMLVLDEPTSGLDAESARDVRQMVLGTGCGVLVVTHEQEMMEACEEVVVLGSGGVVVEKGRFEDLVRRRGGELRRLIGA